MSIIAAKYYKLSVVLVFVVAKRTTSHFEHYASRIFP